MNLSQSQSPSEIESTSEDETPTISDQEFIVSDSEMTEDSIEDDIALLTESYINLEEKVKLLSKENKVIKDHLSKQQDLLWEIYSELKETKLKVTSN